VHVLGRTLEPIRIDYREAFNKSESEAWLVEIQYRFRDVHSGVLTVVVMVMT
jgi:hypothetical protein